MIQFLIAPFAYVGFAIGFILASAIAGIDAGKEAVNNFFYRTGEHRYVKDNRTR
jgi:hypothetical protein